MNIKNARLDIKTTAATKATLERAATALGITLSAFLLEAAMARAREIIAQSQVIHLNCKEAEQFLAALENPPKATEKLKRLFKKHDQKKHHQ